MEEMFSIVLLGCVAPAIIAYTCCFRNNENEPDIDCRNYLYEINCDYDEDDEKKYRRRRIDNSNISSIVANMNNIFDGNDEIIFDSNTSTCKSKSGKSKSGKKRKYGEAFHDTFNNYEFDKIVDNMEKGNKDYSYDESKNNIGRNNKKNKCMLERFPSYIYAGLDEKTKETAYKINKILNTCNNIKKIHSLNESENISKELSSSQSDDENGSEISDDYTFISRDEFHNGEFHNGEFLKKEANE